MSFDARAHLFYRVANAPVLSYPFPHFYLESVFPDDYYRQMLESLPPQSAYVPLADTGTVRPGTYRERFSLDPAEYARTEPQTPATQLWGELVQWMEGGEFANLLLRKFEAAMVSRFGHSNEFRYDQETRLFRDFTNFSIGPHTDSPRKLISLLFYLPRDDSMRHLGTSIFEPLEPGFTCEGTRHHDFANFRRVYTAPFRPNTLFAFGKTDNAFHGVVPIADAQIERNMLLYNIYLNKLVRMVPPRRGIRWPWSRT
jgi:hypothetical protein